MKNAYLSNLEGNSTLRVFFDDELYFESTRHWLNPLFELEDFLSANPVDVSHLSIHDAVSGRAAAVLTYRLGIRKVHSDVMSMLALDFYTKHNVDCVYDKLVDKILCITEDIITDDMSVDDIYAMLRLRRDR